MNIWNTFAPIYELSMKSQKSIYDYMYEQIGNAVLGKDVLELATGPGLIARHVASSARSIIATDFAPKMIEVAKKKDNPDNIKFEVANAMDLHYAEKSFDVVIVANALHIMPKPEKALAEIDRVLKDGGMLIAPNFFARADGKKNLWHKILHLVGIRFEHEWTADEYRHFLENNGWKITKESIRKGRIDLLYTECVRK